MKIDKRTYEKATLNFYRSCSLERLLKASFHDVMGITPKQWKLFLQTGKLKVYKATAIKIKLEALGRDKNPHHNAFKRIMEIRYGND